MNTFNLAHWNIRGVNKKGPQLKVFCKDQDIQCLCLNEVWHAGDMEVQLGIKNIEKVCAFQRDKSINFINRPSGGGCGIWADFKIDYEIINPAVIHSTAALGPVELAVAKFYINYEDNG